MNKFKVCNAGTSLVIALAAVVAIWYLFPTVFGVVSSVATSVLDFMRIVVVGAMGGVPAHVIFGYVILYIFAIASCVWICCFGIVMKPDWSGRWLEDTFGALFIPAMGGIVFSSMIGIYGFGQDIPPHPLPLLMIIFSAIFSYIHYYRDIKFCEMFKRGE